MDKKVTIHQPNYLPWPGFFYKLWLCDVFVFLDHVKLNKKGITRRTYIPKPSMPSEKQYLTVPLIKHADHTIIKDLRIDHTKNWSIKHFNILYQLYHKSAYASVIMPEVEVWYNSSKEFTLLAEWNIFLIKEIAAYLGFERETIMSSSLDISGIKDEMHIEILSKTSGNIYISGTSGTQYRKGQLFKENNIDVIDVDFYSYLENSPYKEMNYQPGLNMLDLLFSAGRESIVSYFEAYSKPD